MPPPLPPKKPVKLFNQVETGSIHETSSHNIGSSNPRASSSISDPVSIGNCVRVISANKIDTEFEKFTSYTVEIVLGDGRKTVEKRFSDFVAFHQQWQKMYPGVSHIPRPKKKLWVRSADVLVRQMELQAYLRTVSRVAALRYELADFLGVEIKQLQKALAPTKAGHKAGWGESSESMIRSTMSTSALPRQTVRTAASVPRVPIRRVQTYVPQREHSYTPAVPPSLPTRPISSRPISAKPPIPAKVMRPPTPIWNEYTDDESGDKYWHNPETGETTWDCPNETSPSLTRIASLNSMKRRSRNKSIEEDNKAHLWDGAVSHGQVTAVARSAVTNVLTEGMTLDEVISQRDTGRLNLKCLESHLSDSALEAAFGMSRSDFAALPNWKRNAAKKKAGIF